MQPCNASSLLPLVSLIIVSTYEVCISTSLVAVLSECSQDLFHDFDWDCRKGRSSSQLLHPIKENQQNLQVLLAGVKELAPFSFTKHKITQNPINNQQQTTLNIRLLNTAMVAYPISITEKTNNQIYPLVKLRKFFHDFDYITDQSINRDAAQAASFERKQ